MLDTSLGKPAAGIPVELQRLDASGAWKKVGNGITGPDGRVNELLAENHKLEPGSYRLIFDTGAYFLTWGVDSMFLSVIIPFEIKEASEHYHIPLLLSPYGYSTYRGS